MKRKRSGQNIKVAFWGVRGSVSSHDPANRRYGGHTASIAISYGPHLIVCDGGTGIHRMGHRLASQKTPVHLFLSHLHWDHIFGLPFFVPFYQRGRSILFAGPSYHGESFKKTLAKIMRPPYFPVGPEAWQANIRWKNLGDGSLKVGPIRMEAREVIHQGRTFGFQFYFPNGKRIVYVTDHELQPNEKKFARWIHGADLLIHDSHYDRREYASHKGWGHSAYEYVLEMALQEKVKKFVMFHHNPDAGDRILEKRCALCRKAARRAGSFLQTVIAREGMTLQV